ncbi:MAG TPA: alpha-N-acetylglucosaminidase, partial [Fimbriimonas sp.]|nr:alpha-N-acetylglucosaminidase [Fimbriimonas sp.]
MPTTLSDDAALRAARGVLDRVLGDSHGFDLSIIPSQDGLDVFEVEASGGRVSVAGSSPIALCRGAYEYLKDACKWQFSWSTESAPLPLPLPDCPPRRVVCPNRYRFYFSVCTFAYTMAWWRWDRWEREIDWMALHGINMPLSLTGQEKVWQTVFRQFDVGEESIRNHFSGPAYLPWHRMGNLNGRLGPLPQSWIEGQAELQKRILGRELELGMAPIVPGFSGFVPVDFDTRHPEVELFSPTPWAGFEPTKFVDPRSPLFVEMGAAFIDEYLREFGTGHFYLCDTFSEQNPRFAPSEELEYLRATGRSTFNASQKADPEGVWVTHGWPFYYARDYWSDERLEALLGSVPAARLIVLDLACNEHEVWRDKALVR